MSFIAIVLINLIIVVGGGETGDVVAEKLKKTGKQLDRIEKNSEKETKINVNVNPVINFNPTIKVKPVIINKTSNGNETQVK